MRKFSMLLAAGLTLAAIAMPSSAAQGRGKKIRPNVVLISMDDLRSDRLSCYGNPTVRTPVMDSIARGGFLFEKAFSQTTETLSSHLSVFTSMNALTHQIIGASAVIPFDKLPAMVTESFKKAGYSTAGFGGRIKMDGKYGFRKGFDVYVEREHDAAKRWIVEKAKGSQPFFFFFHTFDVNAYHVDIGRDEARLAQFSYKSNRGDRDHDLHLINKDMYDHQVEGADYRLGEVLRLFDELGLSSSTLFVLISDHGESLCEDHDDAKFHAYYHFIAPYEEQLHVPLLVKLPSAFAHRPGFAKLKPRRIPEHVDLIDVAPTLLDLCGLPIPKEFEGRSLRPALEGRKWKEIPHFAVGKRLPPGSTSVYNWKHSRGVSVSLGTKKYIRYPFNRAMDEFYDLSIDPLETANRMKSDAASAEPLIKILDKAMEQDRWKRPRYKEQDRTPIENPALKILQSLGYLE